MPLCNSRKPLLHLKKAFLQIKERLSLFPTTTIFCLGNTIHIDLKKVYLYLRGITLSNVNNDLIKDNRVFLWKRRHKIRPIFTNMLQRKDKYLNVILLALEFPFACFLALFTLDGSSSMHAFKEHPWAIFMERFLFTLIPILSVVFLFLLILNISFILFYKDKNPRKTFTYKFFAIHTLHVSLMVLLLLLLKLLIFGYC